MNNLIKRLEEAEEGSRALNGAIWKVVDPQAARIADSNVRAMGNRGWTKEEADRNAEIKLRRLAPPYTTSLDAALTLVPKGWTRSVDATLPPAGITVELYHGKLTAKGDHVSEAIATVIAALKARL